MTMDIANNVTRPEVKMSSPHLTADELIHTTKPHYTSKNGSKRSFDVAFLMLPDEKFKQKDSAEKQQRLDRDSDVDVTTIETVKNNNEHRAIDQNKVFNSNVHINANGHLEYNIMRGNNQNVGGIRVARFPQRSPRIYDDPTILPTGDRTTFSDMEAHKSAFTKVAHIRLDSPAPPSSPDQLSCPSTSPPASNSPPRLYHNFRPEYQFVNANAFPMISQMQGLQSHSHKMKHQFMYRPIQSSPTTQPSPGPHNGGGGGGGNNNKEMSNYMQNAAGPFPFGGGAHPFAPQHDLGGIVRNPAAAAILSTLIPPTLATTFSLTAQNVCAKCNISFRMTSDLVYHMRSHHKSENPCDPSRRKREEKLKCPVCNESFRERHHLTRHMTAHQDKASDESVEVQRRTK